MQVVCWCAFGGRASKSHAKTAGRISANSKAKTLETIMNDSSKTQAEVRVLDAGFSTQLAKHVGSKIEGDPLWTSRFLDTNPQAVYQTHLDFLRAGSDIIETNTYQASIPGFMKYLNKTETESRELMKKAVELARKAVNDYKDEIKLKEDVSNTKPQIAGSIGPYAASLLDGSEYTGGSYKEPIESIIEWHKPRFEMLINSGIDLLAIETIPCAKEAEALMNLLKQYPGTKAWLSFSCKNDGKSIADGTNFKETVIKCYKAVNPGQIIACGVNCLAPRSVTPLLKTISQEEIGQFIPMIAYPNSGENYSAVTHSWTIENDFHPPEEFVKEWLDIGLRYIGGCCRTDAKDIERIAAEVKRWKKYN